MKYTFIFLASLVFCTVLEAQTVQATLKPGSSSNSVIIALKPSGNFSGQITALEFTLQVPTSVNPPAVASIKSNPLSSFVSDLSYSTLTTTEGGFTTYVFGATTTGTSAFNFSAGTEFNALEVQFTNGPLVGVSSPVRLASLANGGLSFQGYFYIEVAGADRTNQAAMFYGAGATNNAAGYTAYSYVSVSGIVLPLKWLNFNAIRQANDALVSWTVDNDQDNEKYIVERSVDGTNFTPVNEVAKRSGSGSKQYSFLDRSITNLGSKIIYYRIKSMELNSRYSYTEIKNVRLDVKGETSLFPNPAKDGFTLSVPYLNPDQQKIQLHLVNGLGQIIDRKDITRQAATNYYYNVQSSLIVSGEYLLKIFEDGELTETKRVLIKK